MLAHTRKAALTVTAEFGSMSSNGRTTFADNNFPRIRLTFTPDSVVHKRNICLALHNEPVRAHDLTDRNIWQNKGSAFGSQITLFGVIVKIPIFACTQMSIHINDAVSLIVRRCAYVSMKYDVVTDKVES